MEHNSTIVKCFLDKKKGVEEFTKFLDSTAKKMADIPIISTTHHIGQMADYLNKRLKGHDFSPRIVRDRTTTEWKGPKETKSAPLKQTVQLPTPVVRVSPVPLGTLEHEIRSR